jgi:hypothetical protein
MIQQFQTPLPTDANEAPSASLLARTCHGVEAGKEQLGLTLKRREISPKGH